MKRVCCLAIAIVAMTAAGHASASQLTSPAGTAYTSWITGTQAGGHFVFHIEGALEKGTLQCNSSHLQFTAVTHGSTVTAEGQVAHMPFWEECTGSEVIIEQALGFFAFHPLGNGNATVTSSGLEITSNILGIHCKYLTNNTHFGTFTGSKSTGGNAILHLASASIPRTATSSILCGSARVTSGGSYQIESPSYLDVS